MISDYLDRDSVLSETRAHRDSLMTLQKKVLRKDYQVQRQRIELSFQENTPNKIET